MEETAAKLEKDDEEDFGTGKFAKYQKMIWDVIEKPDTSKAAQVIYNPHRSGISVYMIINKRAKMCKTKI